jgi:type II secretory pathway pseudopilin PulG
VIQSKGILLLLLLALLTVTAVLLVLRQHGTEQHERESQALQHASNAQDALRKTAEFLMPDTKSDIRFGKSKSAATASASTPIKP